MPFADQRVLYAYCKFRGVAKGGSRGGPDPPPPPILCLSAKRGLLSAYLTFGYSVDKNRMRKFKNTVKCREKMAIKCAENSKKMPTKYQVAQDC